MITLLGMRSRQAAFIAQTVQDTRSFIDTLDTKDIQTILLSGSVARGEFCPGPQGGMVDLTVMRKSGSRLEAVDVFGPDQEPEIPFHCVVSEGIWYSIAFCDFIDGAAFPALEEARKFALLESRPLFDADSAYSRALETISRIARKEVEEYRLACLNYIGYLLSDYKKGRWELREAYPQLHANLNCAIQKGIACLFYLNGQYLPAEDRRLYFSYDLQRLPPSYPALLRRLFEQDLDSHADYQRREDIFKAEFLPFL